MTKFLILFLFQFSLLFAQVVFVPINNNVYSYLDRMNIKGIISLDTEVKPFSRIYIAQKLATIKEISVTSRKRLTMVDFDLLDFYTAEYGGEIERQLSTHHSSFTIHHSTFFSTDSFGCFRFVNYSDSLFTFNLSPIAEYGISNYGGESGHNRTGGLELYITASNWFGGFINMRDNGEFGSNIDKDKYLTPQRGADFINAPDGIEYSDVRAQINFNWSWGAISLKKDYSEWGNSYFGNTILSDKAPSYPHIYLEIKPAKWFRFYYQFGWLHSGVIDSARTIVVNNREDFYLAHERFVKKYFTINMMTVTPWSFLDFSIGNAAIYAGDIRPEMFIPFNFYKYMDRDTGKKSVEDSNGMFFFDMALRYPKTFKFYASLFVDVTSIRALLNNTSHETWVGYTIGGKSIDLFLDNLDLTIEYTKVTPWVYEHKYEGLTNYKHINYNLGHWIGQNSDQFRIQFNYQPIRGLRTKIYTEFIRKGGLDDIEDAYSSDVKPFPFLYSPVRNDFYFGIDISYEVINGLFIKGGYKYSDVYDEDKNRTEMFMLGKNNRFNLNLSYGI